MTLLQQGVKMVVLVLFVFCVIKQIRIDTLINASPVSSLFAKLTDCWLQLSSQTIHDNKANKNIKNLVAALIQL